MTLRYTFYITSDDSRDQAPTTRELQRIADAVRDALLRLRLRGEVVVSAESPVVNVPIQDRGGE